MQSINQKMKDIISGSMLDIIKQAVISQIEMKFLFQNHNTWDSELPERLQKMSQFPLDLKDDSLEDCYFDDDNNLVLVMEFDGETFSKVLEEADIAQLLLENGQAYFAKPFNQTPEITIKEKKAEAVPDDVALEISMAAFKKNNPDMFK